MKPYFSLKDCYNRAKKDYYEYTHISNYEKFEGVFKYYINDMTSYEFDKFMSKISDVLNQIWEQEN